MTVIDDYLHNIDPAHRKELERIRAVAKELVPDAVETISYGMPTLKYNGKGFLAFDVHAEHIGLYPFGAVAIEEYKAELTEQGYGLSKGSIRVPFDKPIPESLLKKIITFRISKIT